MDGPGRQSLASLSVANVETLPERPAPPEYLTEIEAVEWRAIVSTRSADYFMRDSHPVLAAYCQAIAMHRELVRVWNLDESTERYKSTKDLVQMINSTAGLMASLATKLRLTQQARYTPQSANTASKKADGRSLWKK